MNSRPLTYVPLESVNQEALTPNHFLLYGSSGMKQPMTNPDNSGNILRDSYSLAKRIVDEFWTRWTREYLPMQTRRVKWFEPVKPLEPGDVVVVVDETAKNRWERGRVLETYPDKPAQVRRAKVQTARGVFIRHAVKLAILDVADREIPAKAIASETEVIHGVGNVDDTPRRYGETVKPLTVSQTSRCREDRLTDTNRHFEQSTAQLDESALLNSGSEL